jgi:hypothetical protein
VIFVFDNKKALNGFVNSGWKFGGQFTAPAKTGHKGRAGTGAASVSDGVWMYQLNDKVLGHRDNSEELQGLQRKHPELNTGRYKPQLFTLCRIHTSHADRRGRAMLRKSESMGTMNERATLQKVPDFSLVLGGPLFRLFRRANLSGSVLELPHRRILVITAVAWLPLLILSSLEGHVLRGVTLPFLNDIQTQVRFLIALPILLAAELIVHLRLRPVVQTFVDRNIVTAKEIPQFHEAVDSAMQWRDSIRLEFGLLIFVYAVGPWLWRSQIALGTSAWYAIPENRHLRLTPPGYWIAFVSVPIFQFILLRWYLRLFIWFRFLWQASRLNLNLIPTHPDRAGGLAFLGRSPYAFAPILFAQGAMLAGMIANRVLYGGENLLSFKMEAVGLVAIFMLATLGPLTVFTPKLARAKRKGFADYGLLASRYVGEFEQKWVKGRGFPSDELLGSGDLQSLSDLGNSYSVIGEMRAVPFSIRDMVQLAAVTAAPLVPLGLIIFSLEELLTRLVKVIL